MDECSSVLNEIIKAKGNIKRKYDVLRNGEANTRSLVEHTFKPIIKPLTEISQKQPEKYNTFEPKNEEDVLNYKEPISTLDNSFQTNKNQTVINKWFQPQKIDKIYGPKQLSNGVIKLGKKEIDFDGDTLNIEEKSYLLTPGLEQLLFLKDPKLYLTQDLNIYKEILAQTSAHLSNSLRIKKGGHKYNIILKLFPSGKGLNYGGLKLQKHNLIYWNNPNELVDRLRLLLASQAAGNTSVSNEILSIFEELYEAGIIKRIPNV
jgi:hypothetical protein